VVGAADSVCVSELRLRAASASLRVLGVRPDGVEMPEVKLPSVGGGRRESVIVEDLLVDSLDEGGVRISSVFAENVDIACRLSLGCI